MWELPMIEALTEELSRVILVQHEEDKVLWKSALIGVYLVKVGYQFVSFNFSHAEDKLKLMCGDLLAICHKIDGTLEHPFFTCEFASKVWNHIYSWLGTSTPQHKEPLHHFFQHECRWLGSLKNQV